MVEKKMPDEAKIIITNGKFYQLAVVEVTCISHKCYGVGFPFTQLVEQIIKRKALSDFILGHRRKSNVFF